ncbi:MAG: hypothetical protein OES79_11695 [Planctomycetota bacterium]|nr:hypothetical protein [Planctomycetota bacterium]
MKRTALVLMTSFLANTASVALAHPGHGTGGENHSLVHYLTEPAHVVPMLGLFVGAAFVILCFRGWVRRPQDMG